MLRNVNAPARTPTNRMVVYVSNGWIYIFENHLNLWPLHHCQSVAIDEEEEGKEIHTAKNDAN